jgi:hypothetical protein
MVGQQTTTNCRQTAQERRYKAQGSRTKQQETNKSKTSNFKLGATENPSCNSNLEFDFYLHLRF